LSSAGAGSTITQSFKKKNQNILGETGVLSEWVVPVGQKGLPEERGLDFYNRVPGANLQSTLRCKIKVPRWLSKMIAEYDVNNDFWTATEARMSSPFRPFSTTVYLPNQDLVVLGGLDSRVPNRPTFQASVILISERPLDSYENIYEETRLPDMLERRGCTAALFHEGYIYVIGGLNYSEKCLRKCERFRLVLSTNAVHTATEGSYDNEASLEKWKKTADMKEARKNASACSMTADTLYVFGGTSNTI